MLNKDKLREVVGNNLDSIMQKVNSALRGEDLENIEPILKRLGKGGQVPHWFNGLKMTKALPNLDGKTIGSVVEMLLVSVFEIYTLKDFLTQPLKMNPARGVDLPDLDLGIKSPSENYCTSEPFFSAYERLLGSEYDALVLLTDYQTAKKHPPLRLQIIRWRYLKKTQIADANLCRIALKHRASLNIENTAWAQKICRFLAFVNQSDWRAKKLLTLIDSLGDEKQIGRILIDAKKNFIKTNIEKTKQDKPLLPDSEIEALNRIKIITPLRFGVIDAADNWVIETQKEAGRFPSENEWNRFTSSPLDGEIGMSFALQWRYNFGKLFVAEEENAEE